MVLQSKPMNPMTTGGCGMGRLAKSAVYRRGLPCASNSQNCRERDVVVGHEVFGACSVCSLDLNLA